MFSKPKFEIKSLAQKAYNKCKSLKNIQSVICNHWNKS